VRTRPLETRDLPFLEAIYRELPYRFDGGFPDFLGAEYEAAEVVVDVEDRPLMVCGAKKAIEMVMVCDPARPVLIRLAGIGLLHERMRAMLQALGYQEATSFVPPEIERTHGRTMAKRFGWLAAWKAYRVT
jgi:hypothetical protein